MDEHLLRSVTGHSAYSPVWDWAYWHQPPRIDHRTSAGFAEIFKPVDFPFLIFKRKHRSEKTDSSISLTYQQIHNTEKTVRQLGEIPTNNKHRTVSKALQTKEVTMKKTNLKLNFVACWAVALSVFVGAGGAQYICARSDASFTTYWKTGLIKS